MSNKHYKDTDRDNDKKLTPLERLKNATSDEEIQREFDNILEENRKAMDDWFRVAMFGERENKKD